MMNQLMTNGSNNSNTGDENFEMQQIMNLVGQSAMNINAMSKQLGVITTSLDTVRTDIGTLTTRVDSLELNEEITTEQEKFIRTSAEKRVVEIIGNDPLERQKYFRIFIMRLYSDARRNTGLASCISKTKKRDYQRVIDYIEAWIPGCGCAELRVKADANAKARLEAKKLGYTS